MASRLANTRVGKNLKISGLGPLETSSFDSAPLVRRNKECHLVKTLMVDPTSLTLGDFYCAAITSVRSQQGVPSFALTGLDLEPD